MSAKDILQSARCHAVYFAGGQMRPKIVTKIIFPVKDMTDAKAFYESLGFEVKMYDDGYAWIHNEDGELFHLALRPELDPAANAAAGYFHVSDVDAWHKEISSAHAQTSALDDTPWNMREFSIKDPSGNLLRFGSNLD